MEPTKEWQPFAHRYTSWRMPWLVSLGINALLVLGLVTFMMLPAGETEASKGVDIAIVSDSEAGSAPAKGPKVTAPAQAKVAPPKPLSPEAVKAIQDGVPVKEVEKTYTPQTAATTTTATEAGTSAAVSGDGSGNGAATGSTGNDGNGLGTGEGTGGGIGDKAAPAPPHDPVIVAPQLIRAHQPTLHLNATVVVGMYIDENGNVTDVDVVSAEGDSRAVGPSLAAARKFKFSPKTIDGVGAPSYGTRTFTYRQG